MEKVFVVFSTVNLSMCDTSDNSAVVGVASSKEKAEMILKEEVQNFYDNLYEMTDGQEEYNSDDLTDLSYFDFRDDNWDVMCEVKILEMQVEQ